MIQAKDKEQLVVNLKDKVRRVIALYEDEKNQNTDLQQNITNLNKQLNNKDEELHVLNSRVDLLSMAKSIDAKDSGQNIVAKNKIDDLVNEIDKCISLLNSRVER